jgi:class 3 adenylate cyclase/predicted ATPase
VAVKLLHPTLLETAREEALARFLAEMGTLVKLEHDGIARIYDGGLYEDPHTHDQIPYIAMELVRGGLPLTTYARDYALTWPERLALFLRVYRAVQYAHEHRVVHRDLKPANILVDPDGRPVIIDFGLAQAYDALLPGAHYVASGTPAYMSPEQVSERFGDISTKSDVYALGLMLYELLTGQPPYALPRDSAVEELYQVITEAMPPPLSQHDKACGGELEAIVAAVLAKRPAERIPLAVLRSRLERYLQTLPPEQARPRHDASTPQGELQHPRRPTAQHALAQAGMGWPPPLVQPAPPALSPAAGISSGPGAVGYMMAGVERRQLTVLFCDLVGSTALSGQLDPEDLREVLQAYRETCAAVITRFGGRIAKFLGDGTLVCFGYPQAHEDDPQRAVRAGLGIVEAMANVTTRLAQTWNVQLVVRLGIHTGLVVAGDLGEGETREPQAIVGETPNIAARLQELAAPNTVVCSAATARLVEGYFVLETLGPQVLKGVAMPVLVHRVVGESTAQTRLDIAAPRGLTPFVGREPEVALLLERWAYVTEGLGQVVLLGGEGGIGKSRLVQVLKDHVANAPHTRFECCCSPYYTNSAFYPVIDLWQRVLRFETDEAPGDKLRTLEQRLVQARLPLAETVPLFAALLSLPLPEGQYPPLALPPQRQKQKTLEALLAFLMAHATQEPVLFIVEDLHWVDPSTLEFLGLLVDQGPTARILTLCTFRPQFTSPWPSRAHIAQLTLTRLPHPQVGRMVTAVAGAKALPAEVVQQIVTKSDGVPLFVEELTKLVLASDWLREHEDHYTLTGPLPPLAIPATLQDALMARLDQLAAAKAVAQLGAILGREFTYELLRAVAPMDELELWHGLVQLVQAEVLYQRGALPQATYLFKHALIQEAAYQSLLRNTRQQYHQRIVQVFAERFPDTVATQPELLAHHYTEAGLAEQAVGYWYTAGQRAHERSAHGEAIGHLCKGLELLTTLPDTLEHRQQELALQVTLGAALTATQGLAAPDVAATYQRARELCQQVGETPQLFPVLGGLVRFYIGRRESQTARELGEQMLSLTQRVYDPAGLANAHITLGNALFSLQEWNAAQPHLEHGVAFYNAQQHRFQGFLTETHQGVIGLRCLAQVLGFLGYPDQALQRSQEALTLARELAHPASLATALFFAAMVHMFRREGQHAYEQAEAALGLAREHGFALRVAQAMILRGWALTAQGQGEDGLAQLRQGLAALRATGSEPGGYLILLAAAYGRAGQREEGLRVAEEAFAISRRNAALYRLKGELLLRRSAEHYAEAENCFRQALEIARRQGAKSLELRAAMSLSRLWQRQGKHTEARALLAPIYSWFTEGFDTADLREAKALLDQLQASIYPT